MHLGTAIVPQKTPFYKMNSEKIAVYFSIEKSYARHCGITILSILSNTSIPEKFSFYILTPHISEIEKENFRNLCGHFKADIQFIQIDVSKYESLRAFQEYFNPIKYARLIGPDLITNCKKLIYLDSDLVLVGDLAELYSYSLNGKCIGAVPHVSFPYQSGFMKDFELTVHDIYLNSGVLLIDAEQWRKNEYTVRLMEFIQENIRKFNYNDQDALNAIFWGKYKHLPGIWNVESRLYKERLIGLIQDGEIKKRLKSPNLIHYTGPDKPWKSYKYISFRKLYKEYDACLSSSFNWSSFQVHPKRCSSTEFIRFCYSCIYFRAASLIKRVLL